MTEETKVAVVGGGVSGLCAGHLAAERVGLENVLVLERSSHGGGQTQSDLVEGYVCDRGPNGFLNKEPKTLEWVDAIGLGDEMIHADSASARRFICKDDRLFEIFAPPKFLNSPLLSRVGRARLLCEPFVRGKRNAKEESIWDFAKRRIGKEAADTLVTPMVSGVFGGDAKELSLAHCFPRMAEMEREYGGLFKALKAKRRENPNASPLGPAGVLTSFPEGIGTLSRAAAKRLGAQYRTGARVMTITQSGAAFLIKLEDDSRIEAEKVVVASPAYAAAEMTRGVDDKLAAALRRIPYASIAVVCTGYRRDAVGHNLNGFGFLVPRNQGKRVLGCIWTSSVFPGRAPEDHVLLRTMIGGATDPEAVKLPDQEFVDLVEREIHPLLSIDESPDFVRIYRWTRGIPQYNLGHGAILEALESIENRLPNFALAGNAYRGVGLNDCVLSAHRAVHRIL